jgi:tagatose 1,6-diphosphate aldolase
MRLHLPGRFPLWGQPKSFGFHDPRPLIDSDLQLVPPSRDWIPSVLAACAHPRTVAEAPEISRMTAQQLYDFVTAYPDGHQPANPSAGADVPTYHFWMRTTDPAQIAFPIVGSIALRIGTTYDIVMYYGHFGYHVYPASRGHHYAARACRLLAPLAGLHGIDPVWITCNPDNRPSRRTCEATGAQLVEVVTVPPTHILHRRGDLEKCRYRLDLHAPAQRQ